jgi:hypothetical protein
MPHSCPFIPAELVHGMESLSTRCMGWALWHGEVRFTSARAARPVYQLACSCLAAPEVPHSSSYMLKHSALGWSGAFRGTKQGTLSGHPLRAFDRA